MSLFEYVAVMMSVVLALGVARILGFVGSLATGKARFRISGLHLAWVCLVFAAHVLAWQTIWRLRDQPDFSVPQVAMMLFATSLIFVAARILIPDEPEEDALDLETHFFEVRVPFFSALAVLWLFPIAGIFLFRSEGATSPDVLFRVGWLALSVTGLLMRRRLVHVLVAGAWLVLLLGYFRAVGGTFGST